MKIKAAVVHEAGSPFLIEDVELAAPKQDELLVKITHVGVCHTDEGFRQTGGTYPNFLPAVLGHEGAGIVESVGQGVNGIAVGDHVAISIPSCGKCENCLKGIPSYCSKAIELAFGGMQNDGTKRHSQNGKEISSFFGQSSFATYSVTNISNVVKLEPDVDLGLAAPLGCGFQTGAGTVWNVFKPEPYSSIVILGCGSVGLSALMAAAINNCNPIIALDVFSSRLELAKELGATHVINGKECTDVVGEIKKITGGGANYSFDSTGAPSVAIQAVMCLGVDGQAAFVGMTEQVTFDHFIHQIMRKTIHGVREGKANPQLIIPKMLDLYKRGVFPIDKLITYYDFKDINKAFEDTHKGIAIKAVLRLP